MANSVPTAQADNINNFTVAGRAKTESEKASQSLFGTTQDFIKLLTVQLQNQDPTKPLETDQITQQIAQLSQVEQQINTNKNLEVLTAAFAKSQVSATVSYIGKYVEAPGNLISLLGEQATVVYNLADDTANDVSIAISDTAGNVVYNGTGTKLAGRNTFAWNGTKDDGSQAPDGTYIFSIKAKDASGAEVASTTSSYGKVTSVETIADKNGNLHYDLALGDILVPLASVISVRA
jgi:flagellar basal-body rod modification protein FlgD